MRRRQGFTLVEMLVSMALIIFIMAILSQAFGAAMGTFRNLKALGDMAEKLRATTQLLQHDLAADHFEGKKRLSDPNFWLNGPPQQGFFQIYQGGSNAEDGGTADPMGIGNYTNTTHSLSFTVKLRGNDMGDFFSAGSAGGGTLLSGIQGFGPSESRYQGTSGGSYNYQWAEIAWFLQGSGATTVGGIPLYTLYRRQRLLVPDNNLVTQAYTPPGGIANAQASNCLEISCWPNTANGYLYFNSPTDVTVPYRRFGGNMSTSTYPTLLTFQTLIAQGATGGLAGADIQLTDVVSFDVRMLALGAPGSAPDPFVTLFALPYAYTNPGVPVGAMVFDTWSSLNDGLSNYSQYNQQPGVPGVTVPLWNGTAGPIIQAIQISIRIWDYKTNQTRQVTLVQAM